MSEREPGTRTRRRRERQPRILNTERRPQALRLTVLDERGAAAVHRAALKILWDLGVVIDDEATRRALLSDHGCLEGAGGYVRMPEDLVGRALETVPDRVVLYDRNGEPAVDTGQRVPRFCPGLNCIQVLDHETGRHRPCVLEDVARTARVCEALPNIDAVGSLGYPSDVPVEEEAVATVRAMVENTAKPVTFTGHDDHEADAIWAYLAEVCGGWDELAERPIGIDLTGPVSPLKLGAETCRRLQSAARKRVPIVCYPALFPGMAGPITLAGSIAQSSAEALAGIVVHQIAGPGSPVMSGSAILPMDMRRADLAYGSPEYVLACLGAADYFNHVGLPSWIGAGCSDSHVVDAQAAAEVGANMALAALAGTPFIHNLGFLSAGKTGSLEMLVLCDELAGMASKLATGIVVDEETLAVEVVKRAAASTAYLADDHTTERYLDEMWMCQLFERSDLGAWQADEGAPLQARIRDKLADILAGT